MFAGAHQATRDPSQSISVLLEATQFKHIAEKMTS